MFNHQKPPAVRQGDLTVIHLVGTLDGTRCASLKQSIDAEIREGIKRFALNFQAVRHIDSAGIGELVGIQHRVEALGGSVVFTRVSEELRKIFKVSNLDRILHIVEDARRGAIHDNASDVREIAVPLRRQLEDLWEIIRTGDDEQGPTLPDDVGEFLTEIISNQDKLRDNNRVLRDLLLSSDIDLDESEKRYQQIFENAADGIVLIDSNTTEILQINRRIPLMTQLDRGDILGKPLHTLLPDLEDLSCDSLLNTLREQAARSAETALNLRVAGGKTIPVSITASVIGQGGESLLLHVHDISVFHRVEEELQQQVEDLTFLNSVEHQLAACDSVESLLREFQRQVHRLIGANESVVLQVDSESNRAISVSVMERDITGSGTPSLNHRSANIDLNQFTPMISDRIEASLTQKHLTTLAMSQVIPKEWTSNEREWIVLTLCAGEDLKAIALLARGQDHQWAERDVAHLSNLRAHLSLELQRLTTFAQVERAKKRYEKLFDCSSDAIAVVNLSTNRIEVANRRWAELCDLPIEEIAGSSFLNAMCESEWKSICTNLQRLAAEGEHHWENRLIDQEGEPDCWVHVRGNIIENDPVPKALVILIDITDQRNQKEEIKSLSRITMTNPNLVIKVGFTGGVVYANPAVTLFMERCEGTEKDVKHILPRDVSGRIGRLVDSARLSTSFEHTIAGRTVLYSMQIEDEEGVAILHGVEITAQKELESAIASSEESNSRLVDSALEGFSAMRHGIMHTANDSLSRLLGRSEHEIVGKPMRDFVHAEDQLNFDTALGRAEGDEGCEVEVSCRLIGSEDDVLVVTIAMRSGLIGGGKHILTYIRDETERHRLRERVQWLERLAVEGLVASDLTGVDAAELVEVDIDSTDPTATWPMPRGVIDLHVALRCISDRMIDTLGKRGALAIEDAASEAMVRCTDQDLWHVVMCACSALRCLSEEQVSLSLSRAVLAGPEIHRMPTAKAGENLSLDFSINLERHGATTQAEAAFSMWLTMMEGTLHRLRSGLDVDRDDTGVQRIRIFLPRAESLISDAVKIRSEPKPEPKTAEPAVQILVVDDDIMVRDLITEILTDAGFEVISASNGLEGVESFTEHPKEIQAVVLDIMMPVMDGHEAFRRMREVDPCIPILVSSGFSNEMETRNLLECGKADFVGKPFRREILIEKLNALMGDKALSA